MIEFYFAEKKVHGGAIVPVKMYKFHTGNFRMVNNQPQEEILEGEVDEATIKSYPKEYDLFINGVPKAEEPLVVVPVEDIEPIQDIAPHITRASFFDEENDEEKEQEIFIKGK